MHPLVHCVCLRGEYGKLSRVIQNIIYFVKNIFIFKCNVAMGFKPHFHFKYFFPCLQCVQVSFGDVLLISKISYRITFLWTMGKFLDFHACISACLILL